ncbi:hypothetical protein ABUL04_07090 [Micromonospora harpali]|uniref:5-formyltetrahydrofolate cyclo-ligase n=1 Tax=Micromonospora harpali TaxID=1490225 RepID=A0ABW1HH69_9ACTN
MDIEKAKRAVREAVWSRLEQAGQALPPGAQGRIPDFVGAELAAEIDAIPVLKASAASG